MRTSHAQEGPRRSREERCAGEEKSDEQTKSGK